MESVDYDGSLVPENKTHFEFYFSLSFYMQTDIKDRIEKEGKRESVHSDTLCVWQVVQSLNCCAKKKAVRHSLTKP